MRHAALKRAKISGLFAALVLCLGLGCDLAWATLSEPDDPEEALRQEVEFSDAVDGEESFEHFDEDGSESREEVADVSDSSEEVGDAEALEEDAKGESVSFSEFAESSDGVLNGWHEEGGELRWYDDGVMAVSKEVYDPSTGAWYWFEADGTMARNKDVYVPSSGKWARYDLEGRMVKGEDFRYGAWYYFDPVTGAMAKGMTLIPSDGGKWVYYEWSTGRMAHGEAYVDYDAEHEGWYLFDEVTGAVQYGWRFLSDSGKWVRYNPVTGIMCKGEVHVDDDIPGWVHFDEVTGALSYGFCYLPEPDKWVYYDPVTGRMRYGEQAIDGEWYLLDAVTGAVTYGWHCFEEADKWVYYHMTTGAMQKGEAYTEDGEPGWCYFDPITGAVSYGWRWVPSNGGKLVYYDGVTARMLYGSQRIRGVAVSFDESTGALNAEVSILNMGRSAASFASLQGVGTANLNPNAANVNILQFANLEVGRNTVTAAQLDAYIDSTAKGRSGTLHGQGQAILDAANKYGIDAVYLLAHAIIESGWGTSALCQGNYWESHAFNGVSYPAGNYYNFFGWGAFDDSAYSSGMNYAQMNGWDSAAKALLGGAKVISEGYIKSGRTLSGISGDCSQNTLYEMRWDPEYTMSSGRKSYHQYATSVTWASSIAIQMAEFYQLNDLEPNYTYVFPVFE